MTFLRKTLALSAAFAVAVSLFGALSTTAHAQAVPFTAYGTGATAGAAIGIHTADLTLCGTATADADGNWTIQVTADLGGCAFADGDTIAYSVDGDVADETETWSVGGAPADVAAGTVLTVTGGGTTPPVPGPTGNAGFGSNAGTSTIAALLLAGMATVMVAGGRAATRNR